MFPFIGKSNNPQGYILLSHSSSPYTSIYTINNLNKLSDPAEIPTSNFPTNCDVSPIANLAAFAGYYSSTDKIKIFDTSNFSVSNTITSTSDINSIKFSKSGKWLGVGGYGSKVYNISDWSSFNIGSLNYTYDIAISPNENLVALAIDSSPYIKLYSIIGSTAYPLSDPVNLPTGIGRGVCFSPDGSKLAICHDTSPYITIYNTANWTKLSDPASLPDGAGHACAFNPNGSRLYINVSSSSKIKIYDTSDYSSITNPSTLPVNTTKSLSFNKTGSLFISGECLYSTLTTPMTHLYTFPTGTLGTINCSSFSYGIK